MIIGEQTVHGVLADRESVMAEIHKLERISAYGQATEWGAFFLDGQEVIPGGREKWRHFLWLPGFGTKEQQRRVYEWIVATEGEVSS